jgi:1-acyl-sn-glycerol-3-phosphate acyltransferase
VSPPSHGPFLICANHRSHFDSIAIMAALAHLSFADCALLAARDYFFREPLRLKLLERLLTLIPFDRRPKRHGFQHTAEACGAFLRAGGHVLIAFPEGTRGEGPGIARFKRGPALLALTLGLPILPVHVAGSGEILAKGRRLPRPGRIVVRLGSLIDASASEGDMPRRSRELAQRIEDSVRALSERPEEA